jgi:hypothetical protein
MSITCPQCQATNMRTIESRVRKTDGARRRRMECRECGHRETRSDAPPIGPSCLRCESYRADLFPPCWWRFPDVLEEGLRFARDCALYQEVEGASIASVTVCEQARAGQADP